MLLDFGKMSPGISWKSTELDYPIILCEKAVIAAIIPSNRFHTSAECSTDEMLNSTLITFAVILITALIGFLNVFLCVNIKHLLFWTPVLAAAVTKKNPPFSTENG